MPENMMCPDHKATNEAYRKEYDRIFEKDMLYTEELIETLKAFTKRFKTLMENTDGNRAECQRCGKPYGGLSTSGNCNVDGLHRCSCGGLIIFENDRIFEKEDTNANT